MAIVEQPTEDLQKDLSRPQLWETNQQTTEFHYIQ
jgi:hypothetical protein